MADNAASQHPRDVLESSDEEEGEDAGENAQNMNDFIADDADEPEGGGWNEGEQDGEEGPGKRDRDDLILEEEDYELVQEASKPKKKHRKLHRAREAGAKEQGQSQERTENEPASEPKSQVQQQTTQPSQRQAPRVEDEGDEEDDDLGGFIVDEEDEEEQGEGDEGAARKKEKDRRTRKGSTRVSVQAVQEAEELFGDPTQLIEEFQQKKRESADEEYGQHEGHGLLDADGEEALREAGYTSGEIETLRSQRRSSTHSQQYAPATSKIEPGLLEARRLTEADEKIRETDEPERLQLRDKSVGRQEATSFREEAKWILTQIMEPPVATMPEKTLLQSGELDPKEEVFNRGFNEYGDRYKRNIRREESGRRQRKVKELLWEGQLENWEEYDDLVDAIEYVLYATHVDRLEIPFLAMHRKEAVYPLLRGRIEEYWNPLDVHYDEGLGKREDVEPHSDTGRPCLRRWELLYAVLEWDSAFMSMNKRKLELQRIVDDLEMKSAEPRPDLRMLNDELENASHPADAEDVGQYVRTIGREKAFSDGQLHRPKSRSQHSILRHKGIDKLASKFGLNAMQIAENAQLGYGKHTLDEPDELPEDAARRLIDRNELGGTHDATSALAQARQYISIEIAANPLLRKHLRQQCLPFACVSTRPTEQGKDDLDPFHHLARTKHLRSKPVSAFEDDLFLQCLQAEEEGLIEIEIEISARDASRLSSDLTSAFLSENTSEVASNWNQQRRMVIDECFDNHLMPSFRAQVRQILENFAKKHLRVACQDELWSWVTVAPYKAEGEEGEEISEVRVMAACPGEANTFAVVDTDGELIDHLALKGVGGPKPVTRGQEEEQQEDFERLVQFMTEHKPHVCVVACSRWQSQNLKSAVSEAANKILEEDPRSIADDLPSIPVHFADDALARVWQSSEAAMREFSEHSQGARYAVGLARTLRDPLAVACSLAGRSGEVHSLSLHPLQQRLTRGERDTLVEEVLVTATNQVGVGLGAVATGSWRAAPLQFVAGLGPRKAASLRKFLSESAGGRGEVVVEQRARPKESSNPEAPRRPFFDGYVTGLEQPSKGMGRLVVTNALSFLMVDAEAPPNDLDASRIHPESYRIALEIAASALMPSDSEERRPDIPAEEEGAYNRIREARSKPKELMQLNLHEYSENIRNQRSIDMPVTLHDIRLELMHPYRDWRRRWEPPSQERTMYLLAGERPGSRLVGRLVSATVKKVGKNDVFCLLENGLRGVVPRHRLSSSTLADNPANLVSEGQTLATRIISLEPEQMRCQLACRSIDLEPDTVREYERQYCADEEPYYDLSASTWTSKRQEEKQRQAAPEVVHRPIDHANFKNVNLPEALSLLTNSEAGSHVFRPSSRGTSSISLTFKLANNLFTHIDIVESQKSSDPGAHLRLSTPLRIGNDYFEDLDHVESEYVTPLQEMLAAVRGHRKFKQGSKAEVDAALAEEKRRNPATIPYAMSLSHDNPGRVTLSYVPNPSCHVRHEYAALTPKRLRFRGKEFSSPDHMVNWFKRHFSQR